MLSMFIRKYQILLYGSSEKLLGHISGFILYISEPFITLNYGMIGKGSVGLLKGFILGIIAMLLSLNQPKNVMNVLMAKKIYQLFIMV